MNHAHLYSPLSFWEHQSFLKYDYVIVGSGIVGLSTAAHLKEINKKATKKTDGSSHQNPPPQQQAPNKPGKK